MSDSKPNNLTPNSVATSLDELSRDSADSSNIIHLEDLTWEHFMLDPDTNELVSNRTKSKLLDHAEKDLEGLTGKSILELGAYEGYYTLNMHNKGANEIVAIEGNPRNFLKCCAIKNHYRIDSAQFLLGECNKYLAEREEKFDMILAAGILYHLYDPISALQDIVRLTDYIAIDTTYYHRDPELQAFKFTGETKEIDIDGLQGHVLHHRLNTQLTLGKKHGMYDSAWMFEIETLYEFLRVSGFEFEVILDVAQTNPHWLRVSLVAKRS